MTRPIKFRAWSVEHKQMLPVHDAKFVNGTMIGAKGIGWDDTVEVMQFTGLLDRNGKEIYEGDIVEWFSYGKEGIIEENGKTVYKRGGPGTERQRDEVVFGEGWFRLTDRADSLSLNFVNEGCEVIGNIYENPELLTK